MTGDQGRIQTTNLREKLNQRYFINFSEQVYTYTEQKIICFLITLETKLQMKNNFNNNSAFLNNRVKKLSNNIGQE